MGWDGYYALGGNEIVNAPRTEAYASNAGLNWFIPLFGNTDLAQLLNDDPYATPVADPAPWYDPDRPASAEFYGAYPLDIAGIEDSTASRTVNESTGDGGTISALRRSTKQPVFSVVLIAASEAGAEYGQMWLTRALTGGCDASYGCSGTEVHYFASEPQVGPWEGRRACSGRLTPLSNDPAVVATQRGRTLRRAGLLSPPTVTSKRVLSDGGAVWTVSFALAAGKAHQYGWETPLLESWMDADAPVIWYGPSGNTITESSVNYTEEECVPSVYSPIYDPLAPAVIAPPNPAGIAWGSYDPPAVWHRTRVSIPAAVIPGWSQMMPILRMSTADQEARNIRFRFYEDPLETGVLDPAAPCAFVADLVVSYIPADSAMTIHAADQVVYVDDASGTRRRADSLVYASDGGPFTWPELQCGTGYILVMDIDPASDSIPSVDLSLMERY